MVVHMVANMEVDKVADMEIQFGERVGHGVNWVQTFSTQSNTRPTHLLSFASLFN